MELAEKLDILAASARYDASCASSGSSRRAGAGGFGAAAPSGVCHSFTGDGRCVSLLKLLYSNACRFDCAYCANRASASVPRATFTEEELVRLTVSFYRRNYIEGLFLSSGIFSDPETVMERLVGVARTLREREGFGGYIHLKAIPGCSDRALSRAGLYADRLSANIELPSVSSLARLAPDKSGTEILSAMRSIRHLRDERTEDARRLRSTPRFAPAGQSTQLVVGASPDSDASILRLASSLYDRYQLKRVYYSAFIPVSTDPRLPSPVAPPLRREHRLYQADWLLRFYGFHIRELVGDGREQLDQSLDPKTVWALKHPDFYPVDLRSAPYEAILRVPGIGITGARRIVATRRSATLREEDLRRIGIAMKRARWFSALGGRALDRAVDPATLARMLADPDNRGGAGTGTGIGIGTIADPDLGAGADAVAEPAPQMEFSFA